MPTLVDSLFVALELDPTQFNKGQAAAADALKKVEDQSTHSAKMLESNSKKTVDFFDKMKNSALEFLTVFTTGRGFKEFLTDITNTDMATGRLAYNMNLSVKQLGAWANAAQTAGVSADGVVNALQTITTNLANVAINPGASAGFLQFLSSINVSLDGVKNADDLVRRIDASPLWQKLSPDKQQQILAGIGGGPDLLKLLQKNPADLNAALNAGGANAASDADVKAANDRNSAWTTLMQTWEQVGRTLATDLTPQILALDNGLQRLGDWAKEHPKEIQAAFEAITAAVLALSTAISVSLVSAFLKLGATALGTGASGGILRTIGAFFGSAAGRVLGPLGFWLGSTEPANDGEDEDARRRRYGIPVGPQGPGGPSAASGVPSLAGGLPSSVGGTSSHPFSAPPPLTFGSGGSQSDDFYQAIIDSEGTGRRGGDPYDTSLNYVQSPKPLTQMTMDESLAWGDHLRATQGMDSSAKGAFEVINSTQRAAMRALGMSGSDLFSRENQRRIADWIKQRQGLGAWAGFNVHPDALRRANAAWRDGGPPVGASALPGQPPTPPDPVYTLPTINIPSSVGAGGAARINGGPQSMNNSRNSVTVGDIHVHTTASNGTDIARDIRPALERNIRSAQSNYNLA